MKYGQVGPSRCYSHNGLYKHPNFKFVAPGVFLEKVQVLFGFFFLLYSLPW